MEKFIERGTDYVLEQGKLSLYETNCACRDISFYFEQHVLTLMLAGHKTVTSENLKLEFFPGTLFIPERQVVQKVAIPHATFDNPTRCLVLDLNPDFLQNFYEEVFFSEKDRELLYKTTPEAPMHHFCGNDLQLIKSFIRLYDHQLRHHKQARTKALIDGLIIKEILLRLFQTQGIHLLKQNFERSISDVDVQRSIRYIHNNLKQKIAVEDLARVSGLGLTTFFKRFKSATGQSPADYLLCERINQSKILIKKNKLSLKQVAFSCGFNSYEYFCSSFKKIEQMKPSVFKRAQVH
ncbi:MAG: AraC family transcriptional regulator [Bacteroidota bacterium]